MQTAALNVTIRGLVQGIGFRPYVRDIAVKYNLRGYVQNTGGIVEIFCVGDKADLDGFLYEIRNSGIPHARLDDIKTESVEAPEIPPVFYIRESSDDASGDLLPSIPPDLAMCDHCRSELHDPQNRRHNHPFISCTACGPRYTVIKRLPYDRCNTAFSEFPLCPECGAEYKTPGNIRCHAQTISCLNCGPRLWKMLIDSEVFAIKGTGGYHLACNPNSSSAVERLRRIKGREAKPLAVMFPDIGAVKEICRVSSLEESMLTSPAAPIMLLKIKKRVFSENVCQNSLYCGCFLPYTPLHDLILRHTGALVLTSANVSGEPIIYKDEDMLSFASEHNIGIVTHNREILRPIDDSVIKVIHGEPIFFRRARGYVPEVFFGRKAGTSVKAAAMGGDLKSAFCLRLNDSYCLSQPLGDMEETAVNNAVSDLLADWYRLYKFKPDIAVCDMHPGYFSRDLARGFDKIINAQHHHAHVASVMAEHGIDKPVIGVAFDGTGYGADGCIWGGEFLICSGTDYKRAAHLAYVKILSGDIAAKNAEVTAFCFLDSQEQTIIRKALDADINTVYTSSAGRLFDAAAYITGAAVRSRYEGECAMLLEREAESALDAGIQPDDIKFNIRGDGGTLIIEYKEALKTLNPRNKQASALGFHRALANAILDVCIELRKLYAINTAVLAGGVFQNKVLTEMALDSLEASGFEIFRNLKTPPNDGSLALGQAYLAGLKGI